MHLLRLAAAVFHFLFFIFFVQGGGVPSILNTCYSVDTAFMSSHTVREVCPIAWRKILPHALKERALAPSRVSGGSPNLHFYRIVKWSQ